MIQRGCTNLSDVQQPSCHDVEMSRSGKRRPARRGGNTPATPGQLEEGTRPSGAFNVVTAHLLTPVDYPGELGTSYEQACAALGVAPLDGGYGVLLDQDDNGACWTRVVADVQGLRSAMAIWHMGLEAGYEPPGGTVIATLPGWPVECTAGLAGLAAPHEPPGATDALHPVGRAWGPARRRALADQIAGELAVRGDKSAREHHEARQWDSWNLGETELIPPQPRLIDLREPLGDHDPARPAAGRAITAAWQLAAIAAPPPGSARTARAWPSGRVVRATGDGWSLAARTGAAAVLLLDEAPGRTLDISDTPKLQELLDALTAAADRARR